MEGSNGLEGPATGQVAAAPFVAITAGLNSVELTLFNDCPTRCDLLDLLHFHHHHHHHHVPEGLGVFPVPSSSR